MDYTNGKSYYEVMKGYVALFQKYGYVVSKPEDAESLLVEKDTQIGAFTIREDGLCAGAFYPASCKNELMAEFAEEKSGSYYKPRLGWFFYEEMSYIEGGHGNHDFSIGEIELMLRSRSER